MIDICTIQSFLGGVNVASPMTGAHASVLNGSSSGLGFGSMTDRFGSQPFSFSTTRPFGTTLMSSGNAYSLRPDFVSKIPFGRSFTAYGGGQPLGWVGFSNPTNSLFGSMASGGNLAPRLRTGLVSALASTGQI